MLMKYGHSPDEIDEYSVRDLRLFARALPVIVRAEIPTLED